MSSHISFLDDAVERFLRAFELYQKLVVSDPDLDHQNLLTAAACVCELYIALEKGFKHSVAEIDPYLLLSSTNKELLIALRKDLMAREAPSIFCSRLPIDTINLLQTWRLAKDIIPHSIEDDVSEFDQVLKRFVDVRHRAQHGELFEELDEVVATITHVLANFVPIVGHLNPAWIDILFTRNDQLESRLKAIQNEVDANWQVLVDYLEKHGKEQLRAVVYTTLKIGAPTISVFIGSPERAKKSLLASTDIPLDMASGLFRMLLTPQQASDRYTERHGGQLAVAFGVARDPKSPPVPLDSGNLQLTTTAAWLSLHLARIRPKFVSVRALLSDFSVDFESASEPKGNVHGILSCAYRTGEHPTKSLQIDGTAYLDSEWHLDPYEIGESPGPEQTKRIFNLELELSLAN